MSNQVQGFHYQPEQLSGDQHTNRNEVYRLPTVWQPQKFRGRGFSKELFELDRTPCGHALAINDAETLSVSVHVDFPFISTTTAIKYQVYSQRKPFKIVITSELSEFATTAL